MSTFQFSQKIDGNWGPASKIFTEKFRWSVYLWDLCLDFFVTRNLFSQIESTFAEDLSDFLVNFDRFLWCSDWLEEVVHVEVSLDSFDKILFVFRVNFRHLMHKVKQSS